MDHDEGDEGCGTGCEHHIRAEAKARGLTADDKKRFEEKYIAPRIVTSQITTTAMHHACGDECASGCIAQMDPSEESHDGEWGRVATKVVSSDDDDLDELEADEELLVLQQMRMARIVELERQAQQATEAPPVSAGCQMVAFAALRSRLKSRGTAVICGLMGPNHCVASQQMMATLGHCAAELKGITFIGCADAQVTAGPSAEMGWDLAFVTTLPEVLCFHDGVYVGHHGKLAAASSGSGASTVATEVDRWVRKTEVALQSRLPRNGHCGHRHCAIEADHTHSDDEFTATTTSPSGARTLPGVRSSGGGGDGSDSDDDNDSRRPRRAVRSTITRARAIQDDSDSD